MTTSTSDLAAFLGQIGLEDVVDYGEEIGARCFKHEERTGSPENVPRHWYLNRATTEHHCFSCGYKGNLRGLVIDVCEGDVWKASGLLQGYTEEEMFRPFEEVPKRESRKLTPALDITQFSWPTERALRNRGLTMRACKEFGIRWDLNESGWVLPIRDPQDPHDLWGWQMKSGRFVRNRPHKVPKGLTLFGIEKMRGAEAILVESPLDVAYLHELGYSAVASFGSGVTADQVRLLLQHVSKVILALDNDKAGITGMQEIVRAYSARFIGGVSILSYAHVPHCKDPGEMSPDEVRKAIEEAVPAPFWEHNVDVHRKTKRLSGSSGRSNDRAQVIARQLSARSGKDRPVNSSYRAPDRRR